MKDLAPGLIARGGLRRDRRLDHGAADHEKAEPTREGKKVVFDEALSVNAVSSGGMRFEVPA